MLRRENSEELDFEGVQIYTGSSDVAHLNAIAELKRVENMQRERKEFFDWVRERTRLIAYRSSVHGRVDQLIYVLGLGCVRTGIGTRIEEEKGLYYVDFPPSGCSLDRIVSVLQRDIICLRKI